MKICTKCKIEKPLSDFRKKKNVKSGYSSRCKKCESEYNKTVNYNRENKYEYNKKWRLKYNYGITLEDYNRLLEKQNGACAICGTTSTGKRKSFYVDHDHKTNEVRGLLCNQCNSGLGNLGDNIEIIEKAIKYLEYYENMYQM